ncbi:hypothetical protein [Bacillus sp. FJAT-45350]|uniref:hypothetical protein n=1 Tax=Bacillus sp. FJAT-45350 TaxID=2011014 RepID=UPI0015C90715|nr:hypothetical protein [Bacillus sp. FJAT-45350]
MKTTTINPTTNQIDALQEKCDSLEKQNAELAAKVKWLEEQFRLIAVLKRINYIIQ